MMLEPQDRRWTILRRLRLRELAPGEDGVTQRERATLLGEFCLEMFGSMIIGIFGIGVVAQVVTSGGSLGDHDSIAWGWGLGVMLGILVAGRVTGAHLNPAVTVAVAVFKGFPLRKVPTYVMGQFVGWFVAAAIVRFDYATMLAKIDPHHTLKTQGIFSTLPGNGSLPVHIWAAFGDQVIGTAILLFLVFAITDRRGSRPSAALTALLVGLVVVCIGFAFGTDAGYAINPARDFSPRLLEYLTGYHHAWRDQYGNYYFWVPIVGPILGGLVGGGIYEFFVGHALPAPEGDAAAPLPPTEAGVTSAPAAEPVAQRPSPVITPVLATTHSGPTERTMSTNG
jgi:glycerol uptake facilitator protein